MAPLLEVRDLHVDYRSPSGSLTSALAGINVSVGAGEVLGVVGESGSGKSSFAASLLRLLPANGQIRRGSICLEGTDILRANLGELEKIRGARISMVFQEPGLALHPSMRIRDQVSEVLRAHDSLRTREREQKEDKVLASVFPSDAARISSSYAHQLSGGQRQRAVIALAIACGPALLVADEPTAALDPTTQRAILDLFARLRRELGLTLILITHNPALLAGLADRILVLYAGRVAELGPARAVLSAPQHPYTQALMACMPLIRESELPVGKALLPVIAGESPASLAPGCRFEPRCAERMEMCTAREPAITVLGDAHSVSCFKYGG
jgi:oligopeptide/dipeptide ABC transporter ATP-binding protein